MLPHSLPGLWQFQQEPSFQQKDDEICPVFDLQFQTQNWTGLLNYLSKRAEILAHAWFFPWPQIQQILFIFLQQLFFRFLVYQGLGFGGMGVDGRRDRQTEKWMDSSPYCIGQASPPILPVPFGPLPKNEDEDCGSVAPNQQ